MTHNRYLLVAYLTWQGIANIPLFLLGREHRVPSYWAMQLGMLRCRRLDKINQYMAFRHGDKRNADTRSRKEVVRTEGVEVSKSI